MSAFLREHQHELCDVNGDNGIVFGTDDTGYLTLTRPTIGANDVRTNDVDRPQEDGAAFGRDYQGSKTYTFEMGVVTDAANHLGGDDPHRANLDALDLLEGRWRARQWRNGPTAFAMLRSCEGGRTSRCYGRPRRWEESAGAFTQLGYTPVVADFALLDNQWYADVEELAQVQAVASREGGFIAPIVAPLTTTLASTPGSVVIDVDGTLPTWFTVEFHGGLVTKPFIRIDDDLTVGLSGSVAPGQVVTVDPRPWARSVIRDPGHVPVPGTISAASPMMRDMLLTPGTHTLVYDGLDLEGHSFARIRWRAARTRP